MKRIITSILILMALIAIAWIIIKPIAYCLLLGVIIGAIVWVIRELIKDRDEE